MPYIESQIQRSCVSWFRYQYPKHVLLAVPNGGARSRIEAGIMKGEGVLAGAADLFLACPSMDEFSHGLWIEIKTLTGRQSDAQKEFQKNVARFGYEYRICRSVEEFIEVVNKYLRK